jgi:hypothetical protein
MLGKFLDFGTLFLNRLSIKCKYRFCIGGNRESVFLYDKNIFNVLSTRRKGEQMAIIDVKNKKGTAEKEPPLGYNSWLDFWEKKKGERTSKCKVFFCGGSADLGGHVIKAGEGNREFILPMCYSCNNKPEGKALKVFHIDLIPVIE